MSNFLKACASVRGRLGFVLKAPLMALLLGTLLAVPALPLQDAFAALVAKGSAKLQDTYNPRPDPADIILPMPNGLSMVFKLVAVPATGALSSMPASLGIASAGQGRELYDSNYVTPLSAAFSAQDLPEKWLASIPADKRQQYRYYLIAKYEVSQLQWKAVMDASCDVSSITSKDTCPVTSVSWYDALQYTEKYTDWLLHQHPESLPGSASNTAVTGFLRLPTEAEWEYAALGGQNDVRPGKQQDFFTMDPSLSYDDYAVFYRDGTSHNASEAQPIGSRQPNPLGLYDTAGNAAEMTMDPFRFSMAGALLGSAGGFVRKGGSFQTGREEIMPGRREEAAPFQKKGVLKARDLGFRPVISCVNIPDIAILKDLEKEHLEDIPQILPGQVDDSTLQQDLQKLAEKAGNDQSKANIRALQSQFQQKSRLEAEARTATLASKLQNCIMYLKAVEHYQYRLSVSTLQKNGQENMLKRDPQNKEKWQGLIQKSNLAITNFNHYIDNAVSLYISDLSDIVQGTGDKERQKALASLKQAYSAPQTSYNKEMMRILTIVQAHTADLAKGKRLRSAAVRQALGKAEKKGK